MWHEARKQERRIRGMIVDYRKRAERRQDFYERIQADPTQFIQIHGRRCKIHLDPAVAAAGDGAAIIVPWQGQQDNLIDRFDVRAHLDYIAPVNKCLTSGESTECSLEERQCNYERYRILAQNDFLNVTEEKFLHQLHLEEQYGVNAQLEAAERNTNKKKHQRSGGATIGYSYDNNEPTVGPQPFSHIANVSSIQTGIVPAGSAAKAERRTSDGSDTADSDMDMDVSIEVSKLDTTQAHELNACGRNYGMVSNDFYSYLTKDADEADALRIAREEEQEKMLLSGRKSRRERRAQKERRIACRPFSPPSYAAKEDSAKKENPEDESDSRSPSPADANAGKITYITSFGGEDELQPHTKISINLTKGTQQLGIAAAATAQLSYAQKVKENLKKLKDMNEAPKHARRRSGSSSSSKSRGRRRSTSRYRSYSRSRSRSRDRWRQRRRRRDRSSRSRSYERSKRQRYRKSRSLSRTRRRRHYRSSSSSSAHSSRSNSSRRSRDKKSFSSKHKTSHRQSRDRSPPSHPTSSVFECFQKKIAPASTPMISYPLSQRVVTPTVELALKPAAKVPCEESTVQVVEPPPPPPLKRYYGRKRGDSSSELESDSETDRGKPGDGNDTDDRMDVDTTSEKSIPMTMSSTFGKQVGKVPTAQPKTPSFSNASETKVSSSSRLNLRERLKRKMQNLLNKQYKADKRAEIEKTERERQLQQERDDEMRELALKLRRRQRELRHRYGTPSSSKGSDSESAEPSKSNPNKRSESPSSEGSVDEKQKPGRSKQLEVTEVEESHRCRSSRERRNFRSRSRSVRVYRRGSRSRSRSRHRRSLSRRGRRSASRSRRHRYERSSRRRSPYREQPRDRRHDKESHRTVRDRDRDRDRDRYKGGTVGAASVSESATSSNRSRIVISAPPKLKKLVDY